MHRWSRSCYLTLVVVAMGSSPSPSFSPGPTAAPSARASCSGVRGPTETCVPPRHTCKKKCVSSVFWKFTPTHLQSLQLFVESEGLVGEFWKPKVGSVGDFPSVRLHHLLVVVPALLKEVWLELCDSPKVKLATSCFLQLLNDVIQSYKCR